MKTRFAAPVAVVMFAVSLLGLAACNKSGSGVIVDPALISLVPADTTILMGIRAEDLMKTDLYKKYLAERALPPLDDFAKESGLDVRTQVWEILLISNGKQNVALGRGKFTDNPEPHLPSEAQGAQRFSYKGYRMIGDDKTAVLFIGTTVVGVGDTEGLKRVIDAREKTNGPPAVLANRMKDIPREAAVWGVSAGTPINLPPNASANMGNLVKVLNSIESGSFYLDVRNGVNGKVTGSTPTDQGGKDLHDALRGMLGLAKLMAGKNDPRLQRFFDGLRVTQDGKNVNLYIEEQEDAIIPLVEFLTAGRGGNVLPRPATKQK